MNNNVQALRALAAYGVVVHHMIFSLNSHIGAGRFDIDFHMGATGVDVFFVISGFIMAETAHRRSMSPAEFIQHRLARIVPVYWLLTGLTVTVAAGHKRTRDRARASVHPRHRCRWASDRAHSIRRMDAEL